ncbi:MAG: divalent-cation tolerance protein CutA [Nitrosomonas sp.]|nr:MAG: divalent-cation tolerance protein CutA [Nitrosomonas sp.]
MEPILIVTNFPEKKLALRVAKRIVDDRLAACVNILNTCTSVYSWQGKTESAEEIPVLIKTQKQHYNQVEKVITAMHPYELPEIIAVSLDGGLPAYLRWIAHTTLPSDDNQ